ncbi:MAG: 30S ribosomal protein S6 [Firmicutes bacterium]|nr:30S ribosomal protein S6 [Clostridiales bacterium]MBQ2846501.1 30S ribosomal protein S6 [Bacillota bacterium]MBQ4339461.1 30S ribosomal protein S6 [Bacillota bacterium]
MKKYEVMFILDSSLADEQKAALIDMAKAVIAENGEVTKEDVWGVRKLAYPIEKKFDGYYVVLEFNANPELPKELERKLRITDGVMRQLIICKED